MAEKLSYEQFKEWILENYKSMLPADKQSYVAEIHPIEKANESYEGMSFVPVPKPSPCISAQMNLNKLYGDYCNSSLEINKIVGPEIFYVIEAQEKTPVSINQIQEQLFDYDVMKTKLCMRVINYDNNREMVDNSPHKIIKDLAVVYYCIVDASQPCGISTTRVTNDLMDKWGINLDELQADAEVYHRINMKPVFLPMRDYMIQEMGMPEFMMPDEPGPYILTTKGGVFGASQIACPEVLENIGNEVGDFTILPSSVHELLIIPDDLGADADFLLDTVANVNNTDAVKAADLLSYNIYHYDAVEKELTMNSRDEIEHDTDDIEF